MTKGPADAPSLLDLESDVMQALLDAGHDSKSAEATGRGVRNVLAALGAAGYIVVRQGALTGVAEACEQLAAAVPDLPTLGEGPRA